MRKYIGEELYKTLREIYFECYFDYLSADKRKKIETNLLKLKTLQFEKEIVEKTRENLTVEEDVFDNNPFLLGFNNLVYDPKLGQFRQYIRSDMLSHHRL